MFLNVLVLVSYSYGDAAYSNVCLLTCFLWQLFEFTVVTDSLVALVKSGGLLLFSFFFFFKKTTEVEFLWLKNRNDISRIPAFWKQVKDIAEVLTKSDQKVPYRHSYVLLPLVFRSVTLCIVMVYTQSVFLILCFISASLVPHLDGMSRVEWGTAKFPSLSLMWWFVTRLLSHFWSKRKVMFMVEFWTVIATHYCLTTEAYFFSVHKKWCYLPTGCHLLTNTRFLKERTLGLTLKECND